MCKKCKARHAPPTGQKCKQVEKNLECTLEQSRDAAISSDDARAERTSSDGQLLQMKNLSQLERVNRRLEEVEDIVAGATSTAGKPKLSTSVLTSTVKIRPRTKVTHQVQTH